MKRLVIVGGGFAGVWAAIAASQERATPRGDVARVTITLISREPWLTIRPRLYEASLEDVRVPLPRLLDSMTVEFLEGDVTAIDPDTRRVTTATEQDISYDCLVLAGGSHTPRPPLPGLNHAFDVDDFAGATALAGHLNALRHFPVNEAARSSAVVVGAGFTGIEVATTLIDRLRAIAGPDVSVTLVERADAPALDMTDGARAHVERALVTVGIAVRCGRTVSRIGTDGVELDDGAWIPAATTVWTGGLRANDLTAQIRVERDELGRLPVDAFQRVAGVAGLYAAGDVARALVDGQHVAPMSCQFATQMGRAAGINAVAELSGRPLQPFSPRPYVTCLDLGAAGALFTSGWERDIRLTGYWGTIMKQTINRRLIYPPVSPPTGVS